MTAAAAKQSHDEHSHFVRPDDMPWEKMRFPGCEVKTLLFDAKSGLATVLMKMAPGATLPDHEHVLIEQTYVLSGSLVDKEGPAVGLESRPVNSCGARPAAGIRPGRRTAAPSSPCSRSPTSSSISPAASPMPAGAIGIRSGRTCYRDNVSRRAWAMPRVCAV